MMKIPEFLSRFINWVEGDDIFAVDKVRQSERHARRSTAGTRFSDFLNQDLFRTVEHNLSSTDDSPEALRKQKEETAHRRHLLEYKELSVIVCLAMVEILLVTVSYLPEFGNPSNPANNEVYERYVEKGTEETGAVNTVAGMILDYRAFDTLGESNVLFIAVCSVMILLRADRNEKNGKENIPELRESGKDTAGDRILKATAAVIVPVGILFGIYVILNGHLSAGGGFSGGAVIGAVLILYVNAFGSEKLERIFNFRTYKIITFFALISYTLLKTYSFYTGANGLESGIPLGKPGAILSSGLILPLNICVGLVVACTMYAFYALFRKGGFGNGK